MKIIKNILIVISCCLLVLSAVQADNLIRTGPTNVSGKDFDAIKITGPVVLTHVNAKSVTVTGNLTFNNLEVTGNVKVTGPIDDSYNLKCNKLQVIGPINVQKIECNAITITGAIKLEKIEVFGDAVMTGSIEIKEGQFRDLKLASNEMRLEKVKVDNITVKKPSKNGPQKQVLYLKASTQVTGNVTFESGQGTVFIEGGSKVDGKINGASVNK